MLPIYLTVELRWSVWQFGRFDGLYQGKPIVLRLVGGVIADRHRRYKEVAASEYAVSTECKPGPLVVRGAWHADDGMPVARPSGQRQPNSPTRYLDCAESSWL